MPFQKPCLKCGQLTRASSYCPNCTPVKVESPERKAKKRYLYGGDYRKRATQLKQQATNCYLCGKEFTISDRVEADHVFPEMGHESPLAPAHRECNRKRGNTPIA